MGTHGRLERERRTVAAMIRLYCRAKHGSRKLCTDCHALGEYASGRLGRCPFGEGKPTCADCPIHCYAPAMRERIREVMRWAGPRMLWRHPVLAVRHLLDGRRQPPPTSSPSSR
ncbi:MAG TPA: nitrous oxide-stimulated promoter family protein [Thermoanaerobaculaceae bacterium]|nr:nitrous oxide-stimulated promoter family protein [Thermoanaerobaculaceae bacterium]